MNGYVQLSGCQFHEWMKLASTNDFHIIFSVVSKFHFVNLRGRLFNEGSYINQKNTMKICGSRLDNTYLCATILVACPYVLTSNMVQIIIKGNYIRFHIFLFLRKVSSSKLITFESI